MNAIQTEIRSIAVATLLVAAGCQQVQVPKSLEGASSFRFVERSVPELSATVAEASDLPRVPVDVLVPAEPVPPLARPVYPGAVLGKVRVPVSVGVRITVDASGRVAHVGPSLLVFSNAGEEAAEFRAAVEDALAQWRFKPAEIQHLVPGTGGAGRADFWIATRKQATDYAFDLSFTFAVTGDVLSEALK
jgi:hypothetical protein